MHSKVRAWACYTTIGFVGLTVTLVGLTLEDPPFHGSTPQSRASGLQSTIQGIPSRPKRLLRVKYQNQK